MPSSALQTPPTISSKEQNIPAGVKATIVFIPFTDALRFCFLFTFVNWSHLFYAGKLYLYFRSIGFSLYGLYLWNFVKSISLLYRFRSWWQYICLDFYMWGKMNCLLISLRDRLSYVTQSDRNLWKIKIRQISSVTCRFVRDPFYVGRQKNQN